MEGSQQPSGQPAKDEELELQMAIALSLAEARSVWCLCPYVRVVAMFSTVT